MLFTTNEELAKYIPARMTLDMQDIQGTLERVEFDYLRSQVLGAAQYQELVEAYEAESIASGDRLDKLLHHARGAVAHLLAYHYADIGAVQWTATGPVVATGDTISGAASITRIERWKRELMSAGFSALDRCLGFLQAHVVDYPLWSDTVLSERGRGLVRATGHFGQSVDIGNSHWFYWKLRPIIERNQDEDSLVARTLCSGALYAELVAESNAGDAFSPANAQIMRRVRPAIIHLSMAEAVTDGSVMRDDRGVWTYTTMGSGSTGGGPMGASDKRLDTWQKYHNDRGTEFIQALEKVLHRLAAAGELPLYASSSCYQAAAEPAPERNPSARVGGFL